MILFHCSPRQTPESIPRESVFGAEEFPPLPGSNNTSASVPSASIPSAARPEQSLWEASTAAAMLKSTGKWAKPLVSKTPLHARMSPPHPHPQPSPAEPPLLQGPSPQKPQPQPKGACPAKRLSPAQAPPTPGRYEKLTAAGVEYSWPSPPAPSLTPKTEASPEPAVPLG